MNKLLVITCNVEYRFVGVYYSFEHFQQSHEGTSGDGIVRHNTQEDYEELEDTVFVPLTEGTLGNIVSMYCKIIQ